MQQEHFTRRSCATQVVKANASSRRGCNLLLLYLQITYRITPPICPRDLSWHAMTITVQVWTIWQQLVLKGNINLTRVYNILHADLYQPLLACLQVMNRFSRSPFQDWVVECQQVENKTLNPFSGERCWTWEGVSKNWSTLKNKSYTCCPIDYIANRSHTALSMNLVSWEFRPAPANWPHTPGMTLSSAFCMNFTSYSSSATGK